LGDQFHGQTLFKTIGLMVLPDICRLKSANSMSVTSVSSFKILHYHIVGQRHYFTVDLIWRLIHADVIA